MKINLWYCGSMKQWRWTLTHTSDTMIQESGQRPDLRDAMNDVANTVEYILYNKLPEQFLFDSIAQLDRATAF